MFSVVLSKSMCEGKGLPVAEPWKYDYYYVLASKGIQEYILRGDKLKLMIGGSDLVDKLPENLVLSLLSSMGLRGNVGEDNDYLLLSGTAGGARLLFKKREDAERFSSLIPPAFSCYAPGLDFVQAFCEIKGSLAEAMEETEKKLAVRRNLVFPNYPVPGPLVERSPRSGLPASGVLKMSGGRKEEADESMFAKSRIAESARSELAIRTLPSSAKSEDGSPNFALPFTFEELTDHENSTIAILHIDGNGLGKVVMSLFKDLKKLSDEEAAAAYSAFCAAIQEATELSVQESIQQIIEEAPTEALSAEKPFLPFRPLICAGDDVTVVLRAKDALTFATSFFISFEKNSKEKLLKTGIESMKSFLPLTACAGIAFVKKNFPFSQAYELCESLCRFAKDRTERKCSALAFWRLTTSKSDDFNDILERELTIKNPLDDNDVTFLTMMPYTAGEKAAEAGYHNTVERLLKLKEAVGKMPRGSLRKVLSDLFDGRKTAEQSFKRICDVAGERSEAGGSDELSHLLRALEDLTGNPGEAALFSTNATPLHDAVELLSAERS